MVTPSGRTEKAHSRKTTNAARRWPLALAAVVIGGLAFAAGHLRQEPRAGASPHTAAKKAVHYSVGLTTCTFTDPTRSTEDFLTGVTHRARVLPTEIFYPSTAPASGGGPIAGVAAARRDGPFPLVVFAEGYAVTPATYQALLDYWTRSGFVVAAPRFPDTDGAQVAAQRNVDTEADDVNQPADVGFVVRSLESATASGAGCPMLRRLLRPGQVALAGQSDGAETVAGLAYDRRFIEAGLHFSAVASLSGAPFGSASAPDHYLPGPPLLIAQSATDACNPPQNSAQLYSLIDQHKKWFLVLRNAEHLPPYSGTDPAAFNVVAAVTTRFFTLEFAHSSPGAGFLSFGDRSPAVAFMGTGPAPPPLPALAQRPSACYDGA